MLKRRVIPCLDVRAGRVVKGVRFEELVDAGDPAEIAARYDAAGADEVCLLDITASIEGRRARLEWVERTADRLAIPLTVGGGVCGLDDVRALLAAGADKVAINSAAVEDPTVVSRAADRFGRQAIVVAVDARRKDRDRTREGYDLPLLRAVTARVDIPVIASGGVGRLEHLLAGLLEGAEAVLAASIFHFGECSIGEAKRFLVSHGIPVRPAAP